MLVDDQEGLRFNYRIPLNFTYSLFFMNNKLNSYNIQTYNILK